MPIVDKVMYKTIFHRKLNMSINKSGFCCHTVTVYMTSLHNRIRHSDHMLISKLTNPRIAKRPRLNYRRGLLNFFLRNYFLASSVGLAAGVVAGVFCSDCAGAACSCPAGAPAGFCAGVPKFKGPCCCAGASI